MKTPQSSAANLAVRVYTTGTVTHLTLDHVTAVLEPGTQQVRTPYDIYILVYHTHNHVLRSTSYVGTPFAVEGSANGVRPQKSLSSIEGQLPAGIPRCDPMV